MSSDSDKALTRSSDRARGGIAGLATSANIEQARAFDKRVSRFAWLYELAIRLAPGWGSRLDKALPYIRGPRVLEVSFGTGYLMGRYAADHEVVGCDYSSEFIAHAKKRLGDSGLHVDLVRGDAQALPFKDGSFDCLVNTDAFSLYPDGHRAMAEFHRVLKKGGRLVLMESSYPTDRNRIGMMMMALPRLLRQPLRDYDMLLREAGFSYSDIPVAMFGIVHLYVAEKG